MPRRGRTRTLTRAALLATAGLLALSACGGEQAGPRLELTAALPDAPSDDTVLRVGDPATQVALETSGLIDDLDVDRYRIGNETRDTVIAVREVDLDAAPPNSRNWVNDHTFYTHGFGVVAARGNQRGSDGRPVFFQQGIPSTGDLQKYEPRVYFGERSPSYSIVGAPAGAPPRELDFPDDNSENLQQNTTYTGDGGVRIGSMVNRLLGEDRVLVSEVPGTTRDAVDTPFEYGGRRYVLVDTAGIRRRGKVSKAAEHLSVAAARRSIVRADVVVLVLDATEPFAAQDAHIAGYAREAKKPVVVVANDCVGFQNPSTRPTRSAASARRLSATAGPTPGTTTRRQAISKPSSPTAPSRTFR